MDDVSLTYEKLEFSSTQNEDITVVSIKPQWTPNLDTNGQDQTFGLFIDNESTTQTGLTVTYMTTPTVYTNVIQPIADESLLINANIICQSITFSSGQNVDDLDNNGLVSKSTLTDFVTTFTYDKGYIDQTINTLGTFSENRATYNVPNVSEVQSQIESDVNWFVTGGLFDFNNFVTYGNIANVHNAYDLANINTVDAKISTAIDSQSFTAYVRVDALSVNLDDYISNKIIPNEERVYDIMSAFINGNIETSGFATQTFVTNSLNEHYTQIEVDGTFVTQSSLDAQLETVFGIDGTFVTQSSFDAQIATLSNNDDASTSILVLSLTNQVTNLENNTYTRIYIDSALGSLGNTYVTNEGLTTQLASMSTITLEDVQGVVDNTIVNAPTSSTVNQSIVAALGSYSTSTLYPALDSYPTHSDVALSVSTALGSYTATVLTPQLTDYVSENEMDAAFNSYTISVLNNRLADYVTSSELQIEMNSSKEYMTTMTVDFLEENDVLTLLSSHEYITNTTLNESIDASLVQYHTTTLANHLDAQDYVDDTILETKLNTYTLNVIQPMIGTLPTSENVNAIVETALVDYVSLANLAQEGFVTITDVSSSISQYVQAQDFTSLLIVNDYITSALQTYTSTTLSTTIQNHSVHAQINDYVLNDISGTLLHRVQHFIDDGLLTTELQGVLGDVFVTDTQLQSIISGLSFATHDTLSNDYYSKSELFTDTNAIIPYWLHYNGYVKEAEIEAMLENATSDYTSDIQAWVLEKLMNLETGNNISIPYLQENYVSRDMWLQWRSTDNVTLETTQQLISTSILPVLDQIQSQTVTIDTLEASLVNMSNILDDNHIGVLLNIASIDSQLFDLKQLQSVADVEIINFKIELETTNTNVENNQSIIEININSLSNTVLTNQINIESINQTQTLTTAHISNIEANVSNLMENTPIANLEFLQTHFVSIEDWQAFSGNCTDTDNINPVVNLFNYNISNIVTPVVLTNNSTDVVSFVSEINDVYEIKCNYPSSTLDSIQMDLGQRILIRNIDAFNGIYIVGGIHENIVHVTRASDYDSFENMLRTMIIVRSDTPSSMNGSVFVTLNPTMDAYDTFALNTSSIDFVQMTYTDQGSMAHQGADDVNITGGNVVIDNLSVDILTPHALSKIFQINLPDTTSGSRFQVSAFDLETQRQSTVFQVDGKGTASCRQFFTLSDRTLKQNDVTISQPLELTRKLHGKTFEWIDESKNINGPSYGFIAQEVQEHFPSLVATSLNNNLAVDYAKVVAILVESVKELHQLIIDRGLVVPTNNYTPIYAPIGTVNEPHECPTRVTTNIVGISGGPNAQSIVAQLASTPDDTISMTPVFTDSYALFSNNGLNTLDGVPISIGDVLLIKDASDNKYNGVFKADGIESNSVICSRLSNQKEYSSLSGSLIFVQSNTIFNSIGRVNNGRAFVCTIQSTSETFVLDVSLIAYIGFDNGLKSMAYQNHDNVNITGGSISVNSLVVNSIQPSSQSSVSVNLKGNTSEDLFVVHNGTKNVFTVDGTGKASAEEFFNPSDERLKKNVNPITNGLQLVQNLRGVTFDWIDRPNEDTQYGFIAQEVALTFPSLVHTRNDGMLAVDYSKVVAVLVECVKELGNILNV
jgi:hypothetical protein